MGLPVTNWICGSCNAPVECFTERTDCCGKRAVGGYSDVRCPFCANDRYHMAHWTLWSDGVTRPCPCSTGTIGDGWYPAQPNPSKAQGIAAAVFAVILDAVVPGMVPVPVPEREARHG